MRGIREGLVVLALWLAVQSLGAPADAQTLRPMETLQVILNAEQPLPGTPGHVPRLKLPEWRYPTGPRNDITDVAGVSVGHLSLRSKAAPIIRTGVTAVLPHAGNLATQGLWAWGGMLNGNGEFTGLSLVRDSGILNSPILLTNTWSVGQMVTGTMQYFQRAYPGETPGSTLWPGQLPVVGECYDGTFNAVEHTAITPDMAGRVLRQTRTGPVLQWRIGAGSGMRSFELHAGIGSASRQIEMAGRTYHIGVLVNSNHSRLPDLNPQIRERLEALFDMSLDALKALDDADRVERKPSAQQAPRQGSIIVIVATDLPLMPNQLRQVGRRVALGIGNTGSVMSTTSGDGVLAFSTARLLPLEGQETIPLSGQLIHPDAMTPVYRATVEAVTEAQINALIASHIERVRQTESSSSR